MKKIIHTSSYLFDFRKDIEIFGMFGPGNLGDEAMLVAAYKTLHWRRVVPCLSTPNRPWLDMLLKRRRRHHLIVAGGTLIHGGQTQWLDHVESRANKGLSVRFFGTGIAFSEDQIANRSMSFSRWSKILRNSAEVYLRGQDSVDIYKKMGVKADVFGDFAFLLHDPEIPLSDFNKRVDTIGVNVGLCLDDQEGFEKSFITIVKYLSERYRLVFHVVRDCNKEVTLRVIQAANIESITKVEYHYYDPYAFMHSIRHYSGFIGLKLHAAGLAMVAGVPTVMVAYMPKARDFMTPLGGGEGILLNLPLDPDVALKNLDLQMSLNDLSKLPVAKIVNIAEQQRRIMKRAFEVEF
ncbi:MAG: polysaccharide pyruvyl transferase family protein [Pseudomonadota bacterium]